MAFLSLINGYFCWNWILCQHEQPIHLSRPIYRSQLAPLLHRAPNVAAGNSRQVSHHSKGRVAGYVAVGGKDADSRETKSERFAKQQLEGWSNTSSQKASARRRKIPIRQRVFLRPPSQSSECQQERLRCRACRSSDKGTGPATGAWRMRPPQKPEQARQRANKSCYRHAPTARTVALPTRNDRSQAISCGAHPLRYGGGV